MARTMVLNNGTEAQVMACGADGEQLSMIILDMHSLPEIVQLLTPEATAHIEVRGTELTDSFDGYTELVMVSTIYDSSGAYIVLRKGRD